MDNQQKYLSGEKDATLFFDTFFSMCHKFKIDYEKANPKEKEFIDEMTRYNYELKKAKISLCLPGDLKTIFVITTTVITTSSWDIYHI